MRIDAKAISGLVLVAMMLGGCGSITRGTTEPVAFVSDPPGATMTGTKGYACPSTPCSLDVGRSDEFDATFTKPGYVPQTVPVRTQVVGSGAAGFVGNVVAGGIIGMGVDAATGAAMDHVPNPVRVVLEPERRSSRSPQRRRTRPAA